MKFIRQFKEDYDADVHYLVENYRSTQYIIEAANQLIAANRDRMKTDHPIRIDFRRQIAPAGGAFGRTDVETGGKVQVIRVLDEAGQAQAAVAELSRLRRLGPHWPDMAVLARGHQDLARIRALAEAQGIPIRWVAQRDKIPPLSQVREIRQFLRLLQESRGSMQRASQLKGMLFSLHDPDSANPWVRFLKRLVEDWQIESADAELPAADALEFFYEACAEWRRQFTYGEGVTLGTIHSAKGAEFNHVVLAGAWPAARAIRRRGAAPGLLRRNDSGEDEPLHH